MIKKWLGIGVPGGVDDIVIRALKTGVAVFLATPFAAALLRGEFGTWDAGKAAVLAAVSAVVSALINAIILAAAKWSQS